MEHALAAHYRVFYLDLDEQKHRVTARDISGLDPGADDAHEADWGGLTGFSSRFGEAVRAAAEQSEHT